MQKGDQFLVSSFFALLMNGLKTLVLQPFKLVFDIVDRKCNVVYALSSFADVLIDRTVLAGGLQQLDLDLPDLKERSDHTFALHFFHLVVSFSQ